MTKNFGFCRLSACFSFWVGPRRQPLRARRLTRICTAGWRFQLPAAQLFFRKLPQLSSLRLRIRRHITKKLPEKAEQP